MCIKATEGEREGRWGRGKGWKTIPLPEKNSPKRKTRERLEVYYTYYHSVNISNYRFMTKISFY
jgi:hypothetical protein